MNPRTKTLIVLFLLLSTACGRRDSSSADEAVDNARSAAGDIEWVVQLDLNENPRQLIANDTFLLAASNEGVRAYDVITGRAMWGPVGTALASPAFGADGEVVLVEPRSIVFLGARDGVELSRLDLEPSESEKFDAQMHATPFGPTATAPSSSAVESGVLYVVAAGALQAVDVAQHHVLWASQISDASLGSGNPVISDDLVLLASGGSSGQLYAFDRETGERLWLSRLTGRTDGLAPHTLATAGPTIVVPVDNGVDLINAADGGHLPSTLIGYTHRSVAPITTNEVVLADSSTSSYGGPAVVVNPTTGDSSRLFESSTPLVVRTELGPLVEDSGALFELDEHLRIERWRTSLPGVSQLAYNRTSGFASVLQEGSFGGCGIFERTSGTQTAYCLVAIARTS